MGTELEKAGRAACLHSRLLKVCDGNAGQRGPAAPGSAARTRLSSVLDRVAQLESKVMAQKKHLELQSTDSSLKLFAEECSSSDSGHEGGARSKNYSTARGKGTRRDSCAEEEKSIQNPQRNLVIKPQLDLDSDEEEMRELLESSVGFSSGTGNQKVLSKTPVPSARAPPPLKKVSPVSKAFSFHNKASEKNVFGRINSPAPSPNSRNLSGHTTRSQLLMSFTKDNTVKVPLPKADYTKQIQESLESDRSEIKSLDELFSKEVDAEDPTSSSLKDFRPNILSLDDLASDTTSKGTELKQAGKDIQFTQESDKYVKKDTLLVEEDQAALKTISAVTSVSDSSENHVEKRLSEAEISEHLSGVSSDFPAHKQDYLNQNEREYSEDFESAVSAADRGSEQGSAESCSSSGARSSSPCVTRGRPRVSVTDRAAQTAAPPFPCCWAKAPPTVLSPPPGTSYIDPVPIASHVLSMDAVEALSSYSPSVLLLHTLCKQHLRLTQQFVENVHHLHTALVESLEHEEFHYHTLEEAKKYIKNHKSPPLTIEQALEEIRRAQEK